MGKNDNSAKTKINSPRISLSEFLVDLALSPDELHEYISDPDAKITSTGLSDRSRSLLKSGNPYEIYRALQTASEKDEESSDLIEKTIFDEHLIVIGTGIRTVGQLTIEAISWIKRADIVLYVVSDLIAEAAIKKLNPESAQSLAHFYADGKSRFDTYREMVEEVLRHVRSGELVCFASYGHPGVMAFPPHEVVRRAREEGFKARMLPGISAEDCMFADMGIDPGMYGCQSYDASDYILNKRTINPFSHVILWQIGAAGEINYNSAEPTPRWMPHLIASLLNHYPPTHEVFIYEAAVYPGVEPRIEKIPLSYLPDSPIGSASTLYVPPFLSLQ